MTGERKLASRNVWEDRQIERGLWAERVEELQATLTAAEQLLERYREALEQIRDEVPKIDRGSLGILNEALYIARQALSDPNEESSG